MPHERCDDSRLMFRPLANGPEVGTERNDFILQAQAMLLLRFRFLLFWVCGFLHGDSGFLPVTDVAGPTIVVTYDVICWKTKFSVLEGR